ncbi:MAG TPA: hypothetical protein VMS93_00155, partial [Candidatus Saccharimonadales bacterium]|nr:hypothetical protein [Candidatus Saccharimonadales bacterium]
ARPAPGEARARGTPSGPGAVRGEAPAADPGWSRWHYLWLLPLTAAVLWVFRGRTHLLGDGLTRLITTQDLRGAYKAPLDYLFNYRLAHGLGRLLGDGLERGQAVLSVLLGVASVPLLPGLMAGAGVPRGARLAAALVFFFSGWSLMFFGYLEAYPLFLFLELLFLWLGLRYAGRLKAALPLLPVWLVALASHFGAVLLAPALVYAPLAGWLEHAWAVVRGGGGGAAAGAGGGAGGGADAGSTPAARRPGAAALRARRLRVAAIAGALAALAIPSLFLVRVGPARHGVALFLWSSLRWSLRRALATPGHALDYLTGRVNELALVWGAALVLLALVGTRPAAPRDRIRSAFLALAGAFGLAALLYPGSLGVARDWDLLAASLVPAELWLVGRAACALGPGLRRAALWATAVLALVHAGPWIGLQADAGLGREWAVRLSEQGPDFSDFTDHERILLAQNLMDRGEWTRAAVLLETRGLLSKAAPRLQVLAAQARLAAHQPELAARDCEAAWRGRRLSSALEKLAVALLLKPGLRVADEGLEARARVLGAVDSAGSAGRFEDVLAMTGRALERWPGEPLFLRRQAMGLLSLGRSPEALERALAAVRADSADAGGWSDLARVYEELGRSAEAREARARGVQAEVIPP